MSVILILTLLNDLNKIILCDPLVSMMLYCWMSSINSEMNLAYFSFTKNKERLKWRRIMFHWGALSVMLTFTASLHWITQMATRQNICTALQYDFYGVAKAPRICDK
jgi:hypothetical protein